MASGQCNGAVSPLPHQSVDGFFYFHDLNEWFDRRQHEFTRIFIIGWGKDLYYIVLIVVVQYTCDSCYFPLKTFEEVIPQEGEAAILVTENTFSVRCCLNL